MTQLATVIAELSNTRKTYGNILALNDTSLRIHSGEVVAVLGPNGAGKTTLINLLMGLIKPSKGSVRLFGTDPQNSHARSRTGAMLQITGVPQTLKVKEHITLFRSYYPNPLSLKDTLDFAGLNGLENRLYGNLSGGQQQRLHLALALCGNPDLLFLDEPTTGLDVASRRALWTQIRKFISGGRTVVLTTHYLEEADALADRIIVIQEGNIIAQGTPEEIKARTAGRKIRVITNLNEHYIAKLNGVTSVKRDGTALEILAVNAEKLVHTLLNEDPELSGLEVTSAKLEDAFLSLIEDRKVA